MALRIFFLFNILILIYFFKYETIETHARAFLTLTISAIGTVFSPNPNQGPNLTLTLALT